MQTYGQKVNIGSLGTYTSTPSLWKGQTRYVVLWAYNLDPNSYEDWKKMKDYVDNVLKSTPSQYGLRIFFTKENIDPAAWSFPKDKDSLPVFESDQVLMCIDTRLDGEDKSKRWAYQNIAWINNTHGGFPDPFGSDSHWFVYVN